MAGARKLTLTILGNAKGAIGAMSATGDGAKSLGDSLKSFGKKASIGFAAVTAAGVWMGKNLVEAAYASQKVTKQTEAIIKATGMAAGMTAKQIGNLSEKLSNLTGVDDELIQSSVNLLLTFKQIRNEAGANNDVFDRAAQAALDLGSVFGSADAAAMQLGKALADPTKGLTAMRKAGINFSESQTAQIKKLQESGNLLEAQKMILKEVESQVGGTAAAMSTDFDRAKVAIGNVAEDLGMLLLPAVEGASRFITENITPAISGLVDVFQERGLAGVFDELSNLVKDKAPVVIEGITSLITSLGNWIVSTGFPMFVRYVSFLSNALIEWIQPMIGPMLIKIGNFFVSLGKWVITTGLPFLVEKIQKLGDALTGWIGEAARTLPAKLVDFLVPIAEWVLSVGIPKLLGLGLRLGGSLIKWVGSIGGSLIVGLGGAIVALVAALPDLFVGFVKGLGNIAVSAVKWFVSKFDDMKQALANAAIGAVNALIKAFNSIPFIPNIDLITVDTKKLGSTMALTAKDLEQVNKKFDDVGGSAKKAGGMLDELGLSGLDLGANLGGGGGGKGGGKGNSVAEQAEKAKQQLDKYVSALKSMSSAQKSSIEATKAVGKANQDVLKATQNLELAQLKFNQAIAGYGKDSKQAASRQDLLDKAQRDVERAGYGVEQAVFAVADAELNLQEVRAKEGTTPQEIREAEIRLSEAKLAVRDAVDSQKQSTIDLAEAERLLDVAVNGVKEGTEEYRDVLADVLSAQKEQVDAIDRQIAARENEAEALQKVIDLEAELAELRRTTPKSIVDKAIVKVGAGLGGVGAGVVPAIDASLNGALDDLTSWLATIDPKTIGSFVGVQGSSGIQERVANITVNAGIGDPNAIANMTVAALKQYERMNGFLPITAQYTV